MIDEVFILLRDALKAKGVPFELVYGPTNVPMDVGGSRLQLLRDMDGGDAIAPGKARTQNPQMVAVRAMGLKVLVFAKSTIASAQRYEHEKTCDQVVDQVQVELFRLARNAHVGLRVISAKYVDNIATPEGWAGVVYELRFQIDRAVNDVSWVGDKAGEYAFTAGATTTTPTGPGVSTNLPNATTRIES